MHEDIYIWISIVDAEEDIVWRSEAVTKRPTSPTEGGFTMSEFIHPSFDWVVTAGRPWRSVDTSGRTKRCPSVTECHHVAWKTWMIHSRIYCHLLMNAAFDFWSLKWQVWPFVFKLTQCLDLKSKKKRKIPHPDPKKSHFIQQFRCDKHFKNVLFLLRWCWGSEDKQRDCEKTRRSSPVLISLVSRSCLFIQIMHLRPRWRHHLWPTLRSLPDSFVTTIPLSATTPQNSNAA